MCTTDTQSNTPISSNTVTLRRIGDLLSDGDSHHTFYIPSYQRGYRWRRKQAEDFMSDLYSFAKRPGGKFYCLQPVIVRPIPMDDERREKALGEKANDPNELLWELIDGQQRLTSVYLMLKAIEKACNVNIWDQYEIKPYGIYYETRPDLFSTFDELTDPQSTSQPTDIDSAHIKSVFEVMTHWLGKDGRGKELSKLYLKGAGDKSINIASDIIKLVTCVNDTDLSAKVIWYEIAPDASESAVKVFININNGKIPLTDAELVKALFLQRRKWSDKENPSDVDTRRAMQWEAMENRLQSSDFWGFVSPDNNLSEDRMSLILRMIYIAENSKAPTEKGDLFRYFYHKFEGKLGTELQDAITTEWSRIVDAFNALEDWYEIPSHYNYVGYLVHSGTDIADIYRSYQNLIADNTDNTDNTDNSEVTAEAATEISADVTEDVTEEAGDAEPAVDDTNKFMADLKSKVKATLSKVPVIIDPTDPQCKRPLIGLEYDSNNISTLRDVFRLVNIVQLSSQYDAIAQSHTSVLNNVGVFRFPFDLCKEQNWDIEHIDSQTTNPLTAKSDQITWVIGALLDTVAGISSDDQLALREKIKDLQGTKSSDKVEFDFSLFDNYINVIGKDLHKLINGGKWAEAIKYIAKDQGESSENTNFIGNLTMLDSATNRSYHNALFCSKRKYVIEALSRGRYILPETQCVFMKFFDDANLTVTDRTRWTETDKQMHHDYIYNAIKEFLPEPKTDGNGN